MAREIARDDWPTQLTDAAIAAVAGGVTFARGRAYYEDGMVSNLSIDDDGENITAEVDGSQIDSYQTMVFPSSRGRSLSWEGICSCPVSSNCKHTVAVLLAARHLAANRAASSAKAGWERQLDDLLHKSPVEHGQGGVYRRVAIEVSEVESARDVARHRAGRLGLLPLIEGQRGWMKQGVSWRAIRSGELSGQVAPVALSCLAELAAMDPGRNTNRKTDRIDLEALPIEVWGVLRRCLDAGVVLTTAQRNGQPVVIREGLQAGVAVSRRKDGSAVIAASLDCSAISTLAEDERANPELHPIGLPPHGYALVGRDGAISLLPLDRLQGEVLGPLLQQGGEIVVPPEGVEHFEEEYLPELAVAVPVAGLDPGLKIPERSEPTAVLQVTIDAAQHRAETRWAIRYTTASGKEKGKVAVPSLADVVGGPLPYKERRRAQSVDRSGGVDSAETDAAHGTEAAVRHSEADARNAEPAARVIEPAVRDRQAEDELARRIIAACLPLVEEHGRLWEQRVFAGMHTARFFTRALPILREVAGVVVELHGDVPQYREAQETPRITTEISDGEQDLDWFSLRVRVRVGDEEIPIDELMTAVAEGAEAILLESGHWVVLADHPEIIRLAKLMEEGRELRDPASADGGDLTISRFQTGMYSELLDLGADSEATARWREGMERLLAVVEAAEAAGDGSAAAEKSQTVEREGLTQPESHIVEGEGVVGSPENESGAGEGAVGVPDNGLGAGGASAGPGGDGDSPLNVAPPAGLQATLRPYQLDGYRWLALLQSTGLGGVLADDMGLGKTIQVLAAVQRMLEQRSAPGPAASKPTAPGPTTPKLTAQRPTTSKVAAPKAAALKVDAQEPTAPSPSTLKLAVQEPTAPSSAAQGPAAPGPTMQSSAQRDSCTSGDGPVLVIAPTSVIGSWMEQAARFCPTMRVHTVTRTRAKRDRSLNEVVAEADLVVTSYTIMRLEQEDFAAVDWTWVVLDEGQTVKNPHSMTYKAVRRLRTPSTIAITGTPLENTLIDLWSLLSITAPGLLPGAERFAEVYRRPIERGDDGVLAALRARIRPFLLRRTKEQVASDLPPKIEQVLFVELDAEHRHAYERRLARERQKVLGLLEEDTAQSRFTALRSLTILRQMALDPALVEEVDHEDGDTAAAVEQPKYTAKIEMLLEILRPVVAEGHKALVFSQFTRYLSGVRSALDTEAMRTAYLDGSTADRQEVIDAFRNGDADVFLISLKAGGVGLTLTEADYVFLLDPWWNPQAEEQAVDRTHRIGQARPVMVYRLVSAGTVEEKVMALKEKKAELFDRVVEGAKGAIGTGADAGVTGAASARGVGGGGVADGGVTDGEAMDHADYTDDAGVAADSGANGGADSGRLAGEGSSIGVGGVRLTAQEIRDLLDG